MIFMSTSGISHLTKENYIQKYPLKTGLYLLLLAVLLFTRFFRLTDLPYGYNLDEAGAGYDALCLAGWGVDRYLKSWPLYLTNYGSGQSSLYAFLCAGLFRIFGYHKFLLRLPAALFGILTFVCGADAAERCFGREGYHGLITGFLIVICPYFVLASRFAYDCNLMLGMSALFLDLLIRAGNRAKEADRSPLLCFPVIGLIGGLVLYTYVLSYVILPLFLLFLLLYSLAAKRFSLREWLLMGFVLLALALPLVWIQLTNLLDLPEAKLGIFTLTKLARYRGSELGVPSLPKVGAMLRHLLIGDDLLFDSVPGFANLYLISLPFLIAGFLREVMRLARSVRRRSFAPHCIVLLWLLSILLFESCIETHTYTLNSAFFPLVFLTVSGLDGLQRLLRGDLAVPFTKAAELTKYTRLALPFFATGILVWYLTSSARFFLYYERDFTRDTYPQMYFGYEVADAFAFVAQSPSLAGRQVYCSEPAIYYLLGSGTSPFAVEDPATFGYHSSSHLGNYHFVSVPGIDPQACYIFAYGSYADYVEDLKEAGFAEQRFSEAALYYLPEEQ